MERARQQEFLTAQQQHLLQLLIATLLLLGCGLQPAAAVAACTTDASFTGLGCASALTAVQALVGNSSGITISNATFTGNCSSTDGQFGIITDFGPCHYLGTTAGFTGSSAVVLSSGKAKFAASSTAVAETAGAGSVTYFSTVKGNADPEFAAALTSIGLASYTNQVCDAATLAFDIQSAKPGILEWQYVMGSTEYSFLSLPVGATSYIDAFVMSVKAPGDSIGTILTKVPGTNSSVAISTVNWATNSDLYIDNRATPRARATAATGLTTLFTTQSYEIAAGVRYRIKLVVADIGDNIYDTMVWVKAGSLQISSDCVGSWQSVPGAVCVKQCQGGNGTWQEVYKVTRPAYIGGASCEAADGDTRTANCTNSTPCPINCVGSWLTTAPCNASCGNGVGFITERFSISVQAQYNGTACAAANGTVRTVTCSNSTPCPINCQGAWQVAALCNATCNNGTGFITEQYNVTVPAQYGGTNCAAAHAAVRLVNCSNSQPCPINCQGVWEEVTPCNGLCNNGSGIATDRYKVTVQAQHNGTQCEAAHCEERTRNCTNTTPCPVNCEGSWQVVSPCNGTCNNGTGSTTESFNVTVAAQHNGMACEATNGTLRFPSCVNNIPCPVDCTGAWVQVSQCSASCGNGTGTTTEYFNVVTEAQYNGSCEALNGTLRYPSCINSDPCPVDCTGNWEQAAACNASCGNGTGVTTEYFNLVTEAQYNGTCEATNGTLRYPTCINSYPCPVDCVGAWVQVSECNATCDNGVGVTTEFFNVTTEAQYNGTCEAANGTLQFPGCVNSNPCPVDCTGAWAQASPCNATCNSTGFSTDIFNVITEAQYNGTCEATNGTLRFPSCINNDPCPVDCFGAWVEVSLCNASCGNGTGASTEYFSVVTEAQFNGSCEAANGTLRFPSCTNSNPCPVDCIGAWQTITPCNASCGDGTGFRTEQFVITTAAAYCGIQCTAADGAEQLVNCTNSAPCPTCNMTDPSWWGPSQFACPRGYVLNSANSSSQQLDVATCCMPYPLVVPAPLPELPAAGKAIVGGNLSIIGSSAAPRINSSSNDSQVLLSPRTTQLNGTLVFTTLGLSLPWFGNFSTSRLMAWQYKPDLQVFATQVAVDGTFNVQNTATGEFRLVDVVGFVNLLSATYPGPGFTGWYQLTGDLTLTPNPFLDNNTPPAGSNRRKLAGPGLNALAAPVQGAVAAREQRITGTTSADATSGIAYIDPDGSVIVDGEVPELLRAPWLGMPCTAEACDGAYPYDAVVAGLPPRQRRKSWFNVDALLGGLIGGVALLAFVVVGLLALIKRRKRRSKYIQQDAPENNVAVAASAVRHGNC